MPSFIRETSNHQTFVREGRGVRWSGCGRLVVDCTWRQRGTKLTAGRIARGAFKALEREVPADSGPGRLREARDSRAREGVVRWGAKDVGDAGEVKEGDSGTMGAAAVSESAGRNAEVSAARGPLGCSKVWRREWGRSEQRRKGSSFVRLGELLKQRLHPRKGQALRIFVQTVGDDRIAFALPPGDETQAEPLDDPFG